MSNSNTNMSENKQKTTTHGLQLESSKQCRAGGGQTGIKYFFFDKLSRGFYQMIQMKQMIQLIQIIQMIQMIQMIQIIQMTEMIDTFGILF